MAAWASNETSASPGGLIRWPLYVLVPIGFSLLALQSLSELFKRLAFLTGTGPDPHVKSDVTDEDLLLEELRLEAAEREARDLKASATLTTQGAKP